MMMKLLYTFFPWFGRPIYLGMMIIFETFLETFLSIFDLHVDVSGQSIRLWSLELKHGGNYLNILVYIDLFWSKFESGQSFCGILLEHLLAASHLMKKLKKKEKESVQFLGSHEVRN